PEAPSGKNYLSYSLAARGLELDYALRLVEEALAAAPTAPAYIDTLGWIYFKKGRYEDAERELDRAVALQRDWEIFYHVAEVKEKLGKEREAISAYCFALYYGAKTRDAREIEKRLSTLSKKHDPEVIFHNFIRTIISEKSAAGKIDAGFVAKTPQGAFRGTAYYRAPNIFTLEIGDGLFKTFVRLEHTLEFFGAAPAMLPETETKDIMSVLRSVFSGVFYETMTNTATRPKGGNLLEINTADANITVSRFTGDVIRIDAARRWVWKFADYIAMSRRRIPRKMEFFDGRVKIFEAKITSLEILPVESDE
ncbi:MAG: hypothetical protein QME32_01655, partial [Endomicrobiia bacterium]|nr:hypothetical protein [Endomicrobiia bacterium]